MGSHIMLRGALDFGNLLMGRKGGVNQPKISGRSKRTLRTLVKQVYREVRRFATRISRNMAILSYSRNLRSALPSTNVSCGTRMASRTLQCSVAPSLETRRMESGTSISGATWAFSVWTSRRQRSGRAGGETIGPPHQILWQILTRQASPMLSSLVTVGVRTVTCPS